MAAAASVATPVVVGQVLKDLLSKVGGLIDKFQTAGEMIFATAGEQVRLALQAAQVSFAESLLLTTTSLTSQQQQFFNNLTSVIDDLEHKVASRAAELVQYGLLAVNALPFSNSIPQVSRISPLIVHSPKGVDTVEITLTGNFVDASRADCQPVLTIDPANKPTKLAPTKSTTTTLCFRVKLSDLIFDKEKLSFIPCTVSVPYISKVFCAFNWVYVRVFRFELTTLPTNGAGTITFNTSHAASRVVSEQRTSGSYYQHSSHDDIPDPIGNGLERRITAQPGWRVVPSSTQLHTEWSEGGDNVKNFGNRSDVGHAGWSIATVKKSMGTSGKINFHLTWTEQKDESYTVKTPNAPVKLSWGSSVNFVVPHGGTWAAEFTDFTGNSFQIGSVAFNASPYIKLTSSGNNVTVAIMPFT